jgi:hypothetical protein
VAPFSVIKIRPTGPLLVYQKHALLPYLLESRLRSGQEPQLGGTWLSLVAGHLATALYTASLFLVPIRGILQAVAFLLWAIAFWPILARSWRILGLATACLEEIEPEPANSPAALGKGTSVEKA